MSSPEVTQLPILHRLVAWLWSCVPPGGQLTFPSLFQRLSAFPALFRPRNAVCWRFVGLTVSAGGLLDCHLHFSTLTRFLHGSLLEDFAFPVLSFLIADRVLTEWGFFLPDFPLGGRPLVYSPPLCYDGRSAR